MRATFPADTTVLYLITRIISGEEYRSWSSSLCSFLQSHFLALRPRYLPQHPILLHLQPVLLI